MLEIFKEAWRNLGRNRRRSIVTAFSLAVGLGLCVATYGLMDGMSADILHALTRLDLGDVEIHNPEFPGRRSLRLFVNSAEHIVATAERQPDVRAVSERVYGYGLASLGTTSVGVQLVGVDPTTEPQVTELDRQIVEGRYLDRSPTPWPPPRPLTKQESARDIQVTTQAAAVAAGEIDALAPLGGAATAAEQASPSPSAVDESWTRKLQAQVDPAPERPPRILMGAKLARVLDARLGSLLFISAQTLDGTAAEGTFEVAGIYSTGTDLYDRARLYLNLRDLQRFLHLDAQVHEIAIRAASPDQAAVVANALRAATVGSGALVRPWFEIRPDIENVVRLNDVSTALMGFFIFAVAALGVVNTMLMAVFERTREIGMLKAIGMSASRIVFLILAETTLLGALASSAGMALGLALDAFFVLHGVDLHSLSQGISIGGLGIAPVLHATITARGLLIPPTTLFFFTVAAAFYPAVRAARMRPAQGMRDV